MAEPTETSRARTDADDLERLREACARAAESTCHYCGQRCVQDAADGQWWHVREATHFAVPSHSAAQAIRAMDVQRLLRLA